MDLRVTSNTTENASQLAQTSQQQQQPGGSEKPPGGVASGSAVATALAVAARVHSDLQHVVSLLKTCHGSSSCLKSLVLTLTAARSEGTSQIDEACLSLLTDSRTLNVLSEIQPESLVLFSDLVLSGLEPTKETKDLLAQKLGLQWFIVDVAAQLCALRNMCVYHWETLQQIWVLLPDEMTPSQQGTIIHHLKLLMQNLSVETLALLQSEVHKYTPDREVWCLQRMLHLRPEFCDLYQPMCRLLKMPMDTMCSIKEALFTLTPVQMNQSIQLLRSESLRLEVNLMLGKFNLGTTTPQPFSRQASVAQVSDEQLQLKIEQQLSQEQISQKNQQMQLLQQLIKSPSSVADDVRSKHQALPATGANSPTSRRSPSLTEGVASSSNGSNVNTPGRLSLQIVEHPSGKAVYRRNIKPHPSVIVCGDMSHYEMSQLFVVPVLVRCDQNSEEQKLAGNTPSPVGPSRVITFRKLKILVTSNQMCETLFVLRFELRQYTSRLDYRVLDTASSRPIVVVSHSTQLKPALSSPPTILEVVPCTGPISGGTKVVILGANFANSPSMKVQFDNVEVSPVFHGPSTLVCTTPEHLAGVISVRVCNVSSDWSLSAATFTYEKTQLSVSNVESSLAKPSMSLGVGLSHPVAEIPSLGISGEIPMSVPKYHKLLQDSSETDDIMSFLEVGGDINATDEQKNTPLHWAMAVGSVRAVTTLIENGASIDVQNLFGETPLHYGAGCPSTVSGNLRCCEILLDAGADPCITTACGHTSLHYAAAHGNVPVARLLLELGVHPDLTDDEGETALHIATIENRRGVIRALLSAGGNPNSVNVDGETPLHVAVALGERSTADLLLSLGASPNLVDNFGFTPFLQPKIASQTNKQTPRRKAGPAKADPATTHKKPLITLTTSPLVSPLSGAADISAQGKAHGTAVERPVTAILAM
ncbi:calcium-activated BK potassium channel [Pelomyxa schiedti]|nr:calcium-activated BK potassium channel [Pelomyxa schiedti]